MLRTLGDYSPGVVGTALAGLEAEGRAQRVEFRGHTFWRYPSSAIGGGHRRELPGLRSVHRDWHNLPHTTGLHHGLTGRLP